MRLGKKGLAPVREILPGTRRYTQRTIYELVESIRERDQLTYEHCRRVAIYAARLARNLGWTRRAARDLALAALVHDLGKTWMQNSILHKDSALSTDEWREMHRHPRIAARILQAYDVPDELIEAVLHHHESYDGRGYPEGLVGSAIPVGARLLTVADVFDALTSSRPYKDAMSIEQARDRILADVGTHFDPEVAAAFVGLLDTWQDFLQVPRIEPLAGAATPSVWAQHDFLTE